jgi:hypothetical protein
MLGFGTIKSSKLEKNADGDDPVYVCKTRLSADNDLQSLEHHHEVGCQSRPPKETYVFYGWFDTAWKFIISAFDRVPKQALEEGERISYSSSGGTIKAFIKYLKTGIIHINGDTDFAVRFNELETAFNELKTAYNSHNHGGSAATPQSNADISTAKVDNVKLPEYVP